MPPSRWAAFCHLPRDHHESTIAQKDESKLNENVLSCPLSDRLNLDQPLDHVAVALARLAQMTQLVDDVRLKPNLALASR
jgi:hypothetical protein